jgi:hypothetical protein
MALGDGVPRPHERRELGLELPRFGAGGEPAGADDSHHFVDFRLVRVRQREGKKEEREEMRPVNWSIGEWVSWVKEE